MADRVIESKGKLDLTENIVQRLRRRIQDAQQLGFQVRREVLDDEEATWCIVGTSKILFLDLTQTAGDQFRQLNETLDSYQKHVAEQTAATKPTAPAVDRISDLSQRAA